MNDSDSVPIRPLCSVVRQHNPTEAIAASAGDCESGNRRPSAIAGAAVQTVVMDSGLLWWFWRVVISASPARAVTAARRDDIAAADGYRYHGYAY